MKTKKELKDAYKQSKPTMAVFQIKNKKNGKFLIDNSIDAVSRMTRHRMELKFGSHQNKELLKDWIEFGEENFIFETLSEIKQRDNADIDYNKELKLLQEMITEELQLPKDNRY